MYISFSFASEVKTKGCFANLAIDLFTSRDKNAPKRLQFCVHASATLDRDEATGLTPLENMSGDYCLQWDSLSISLIIDFC